MRTPLRKPFLRAATLAVAAAALSACASADARRPTAHRGGGGAGVVLSSSSWLNGSFGECAVEKCLPSGPRDIRANKALKPDDPWLGTVGVRSLLGRDCEAGMGVCLPNPFPNTDAAQPTLASRAHEVGVGVWLKLDF